MVINQICGPRGYSNIIAPVSVGDDAYIAAGTTITDDIPARALVIGRSRQIVKEGKAIGKFKLI